MGGRCNLDELLPELRACKGVRRTAALPGGVYVPSPYARRRLTTKNELDFFTRRFT